MQFLQKEVPKLNKIKTITSNIVSENILKIKDLFPNCVIEAKDKNDKITLKIDFETLKQELSDNIIGENQEKYELTWPGKKESILLANRPTDKILVPCKEESVNWDKTQNLYIEGDNLDVLKILRRDYLNKIKMIYIDPPYNTGKNRLYKDKFTHSEWLNMMYPRLKLARDLLTDDGVIFISIDDREVHNLKKVCDDIFGEENFVAQFVWQKNFAPKNDNKYISTSHEHVLHYAKSKDYYKRNLLPREEKHNTGYSNPDNDPRGAWTSGSMLATTFNSSGVFEIISPTGKVSVPPSGRCWRYSQATIKRLLDENKIWFGSDGNNVPRIKRFLSDMPQGIVPQSLLKYEDVGSGQTGTADFRKYFDNIQMFDFPKPVGLIKRFIQISTTQNDDIILDFFSGSATTAHAVMQLNAEDGGNRKFIMVQLPESCNEKSEAFKAGYKNICEIGKERIRRAGKKIIEETGKTDLDVGFRVLKLDSPNME